MIAPFTSEEANTGPTSDCAAACAQVVVPPWIHKGVAVAAWCGNQDDFQGGHIPLWTLLVPLGIHPVGDALARETIAKLLGEEAEA